MIDLIVPFNNQNHIPYYEQIYSYIKKEMRRGGIRAGERLPSTRQLAQKLGVSRSTTQLAYDQLTAEGYLEPVPYKGYYAARIELLYQPEVWGRSGTMTSESEHLPVNPETLHAAEKLSETHAVVDFSPRGIDLSRFPFHTWRRLSREILQDENRELFASGDRQGERDLREAICEYLRGSRGIECQPEQLVIGAGGEYLLMLLTQLIGIRRIAMENPTYRQASRVMERMGHQILPVSMDQHGMRSDLLEQSGADLAYIMPSHQFPTGAIMSAPRRQEILKWAQSGSDRFIIEDDYDSEFRYRGRPIPALAGADREGRVIYLGTFSKAVAPAIRVSYMVLPLILADLYPRVCGFYTSTVSRIDQAILQRFLSQGYFERHLNRMRGIYKNKHDILLEELEDFRDVFQVTGEQAGLHILMESRKGVHEEELCRLAQEQGVHVYPLSSYFLEPAVSHTVILGYANLTEAEIREGAAGLKRAWLRSAT